jgi:hypothetical protein
MEAERIKFIDKILANKKMFKRLIFLLLIAGIIGGFVFVPCSVEKNGKKFEKGSPLKSVK